MMKKNGITLLVIMLLGLLAPMMTGCGVLVGAAGAGAGYEYTNKRQLEMLEEDYKAGNIDKEEYLKRKKDIEGGSIIY